MKIIRLVPRKPIYIGTVSSPAQLVAALKAAAMVRRQKA